MEPFILPLPGFTTGGVPGKGDASDEDDDNEFFDAMEDPAEFITVPADPKYHRWLPVCLFLMSLTLINVFVIKLHSFGLLFKCMFFCPPGDPAATLVGSAVRLEWTISQLMCVNFVFIASSDL